MFEFIYAILKEVFLIILFGVIFGISIYYLQILIKRFLGIDINVVYDDLTLYFKDLFQSLSTNKDFITLIRIIIAPVVMYYTQYFISVEILENSSLNVLIDILPLLINLLFVWFFIFLCVIIAPKTSISFILFFLVFIGRIYYNFKYAKVDFFTESMIFLVASFVFYSIIRKSIPKNKKPNQTNL